MCTSCNKLDESYKYTKWRSQPEYLGCWGDWFDKPWGLSPRTRAMTRVNSSSLLTFDSCKILVKAKALIFGDFNTLPVDHQEVNVIVVMNGKKHLAKNI